MSGAWTVLGPIFTVVIAILSKNVILALLFGILYFSAGIFGINFLNHVADFFTAGVESNGFVLVLLLPLSILMAFMRAGGGFKSFARWADKKVTNRRQVGLMVFALASALSIVQDLIANLATGRILRPVIDEKHFSREKSAFISLCAAPNLQTPIPYSTYFLFCVGMIGMLLPSVNPISFFYKGIALSFHTWMAFLIGLGVALELIPELGAMKSFSKVALQKNVILQKDSDSAALGDANIKPDFGAFFIPLCCLIGGVLATSLMAGEVVILPGAFIGAFAAMAYCLVRGSVKFKNLGEVMFAGIMEQIPILLLLTFAFAFGAAIQQAGLGDFIVKVMSGTLPPSVVPLIAFLFAVAISYTTGSLGSALVILLPLVMPLAIATNANLLLTFGAVYSGSQWGDQLSPLSDMVIENAGANQVDPIDLYRAALPYRLMEGAVCLVLFGVLGFVM